MAAMEPESPTGSSQDTDMADTGTDERRRLARQTSTSAAESTREHWARQLMRPEWMIDIPHDLASDWYVLPRPEGQRCLLVAAAGSTTARSRSGVQLARFPSALPGGSRQTLGPGDPFCILDAIFHQPDETYYVMDMMCWKGQALYGCSAEFRMFWVASRLMETDAATSGCHHNPFRIVPVPAFHASADGLTIAHSGPADYGRDGLLLLHKDGIYAAGATSPLALLWKDAGCSRHPVDTDASGAVPLLQQVVLLHREDGTLVTADEEPVVVARMSQEAAAAVGGTTPASGAPAAGKLLRLNIGPGGIQLAEGYRPVAADLQLAGGAHMRRGRADIWSKILFQYQARRAPANLGALLEALAAQDASALLGARR